MFSELGNRWPLILLAPILIVALGPTPVPQPLVGAFGPAAFSFASNHPEAALSSIEAILEFDPSYVQLHVWAARAALAADKASRALEHLDAADQLKVEDPLVGCLRGDGLLANGDLKGAVSAWENASAPCPQEAASYETIAYASLQDVNPEDMLLALEELAALEPGNPAVNLRLALVSASIDPQNAIEQLRHAGGLLAQGSSLVSDLLGAIIETQTDESQAETLAGVGETLTRHSEWALAAQALGRAHVLQPGNAKVTAYLGLALTRTGDEGLPLLIEAVAVAPEDPLTHTLLSLYWLETGQPQQALQHLQIAARLDPENPAIMAQMGAALADLGRLEQALKAYRRAADLAPGQASFWLLLAQFALAKEVEISSVALPAARNAVILSPQDPAGIDALGYAHLLLGNNHLAGRLLAQAVEMDPHRALTQYHLALLRLAQDRVQEAKGALAMASQLDPTGPAGNLATRLWENLKP